MADRSELYCFIGPQLVDSFMKYYGFSKEDALKAVEYYREYFSVKGIFENTIFDGTAKLLEDLKAAGKKIVLATSKPQHFAEIILKDVSKATAITFICDKLCIWYGYLY